MMVRWSLTVVYCVNGRDFAAEGLHAESGHGVADIAKTYDALVWLWDGGVSDDESYPAVTFRLD